VAAWIEKVQRQVDSHFQGDSKVLRPGNIPLSHRYKRAKNGRKKTFKGHETTRQFYHNFTGHLYDHLPLLKCSGKYIKQAQKTTILHQSFLPLYQVIKK